MLDFEYLYPIYNLKKYFAFTIDLYIEIILLIPWVKYKI